MDNIIIDKLVSEKVMGWEEEPFEPFFPSTEIVDAMKVVEKINQYGDFILSKDCDSSKWVAELAMSSIEIYTASEDTAPLTICKLALNAFNK